MFGAVRELDRFHQRLFELYYWEGRSLAEATEALRVELKKDVSLETVLDALETVDRALSDRHRSELAVARRALARAGFARRRRRRVDADRRAGRRTRRIRRLHCGARELEDRLNRALATLPPEDAAIVSLKYVEGLTRTQIQRLLRLPELTEHRVRTIVATLRTRLGAERRSHTMDDASRSTNV